MGSQTFGKGEESQAGSDAQVPDPKRRT
jgi:hypothetical protein